MCVYPKGPSLSLRVCVLYPNSPLLARLAVYELSDSRAREVIILHKKGVNYVLRTYTPEMEPAVDISAI